MASKLGTPPPPPTTSRRPVYLIHFLLMGLVLVAAHATAPSKVEAQVIRLRQPLLRERLQNIFATSDNDQQKPTTGAEVLNRVPLPPAVPLSLANALAAESRSVISENGGRHSDGQQQPSPKPGNIIVHLAADQEIERLEYMLRDGRLATVYQRQRDDHQPNEKRQDPPRFGLSNQQRQLSAGGSNPMTTQLVLPPFRGEAIHLHAPQAAAAGSGQDGGTGGSVHTIDLDDDDDDDNTGDDRGSSGQPSSRDLSALVLGPKMPVPGGGNPLPIPGGGYPPLVEPVLATKKVGKLAKAKLMMKKLKPAIIMAKLKKLPKMIATKLAAKSMVGAVALDGAAGASVPLVQHDGNRFLWSTLGGNRHAHTANAAGVTPSDSPAPPLQILPPPPPPPPSAGIGVGTLVSPPGSSNVIRFDSISSSASSASSTFGEPVSHHELRSVS